MATAPSFQYQALFENATEDTTPYRLVTSEGVSTVEVEGRKVIELHPATTSFSKVVLHSAPV